MIDNSDLNKIQEESNIFFNLSADLMSICTLEGVFIIINPAFSKTIGYTEKEILAMPMSKFIHPDDLKKTLTNFILLSKEKKTIIFENRYHCKDGTYKYLVWKASLKGNNVFAVARDVTALKLKKKQESKLIIDNKELDFLNKKKEKLTNEKVAVVKELDLKKDIKNVVLANSSSSNLASQYSTSFLEALQDPLVAIDTEGKITNMNQAMVEATGVSRKKLKGSDFKNYFTEPKKASLICIEVFSKGFVKDYPLIIKDHKLTDVLFNGSVYKDENNMVVGAIIVARNITEQKKITKELIEAKHCAEMATEIAEIAKTKAETASIIAQNAMKSKQQFLSNMSHEIRTPMNAIIGFTKVISKTELTIKQKEYLQAIRTSGDSLIVLINDILDLAKVDAGKMSFENSPFKLEDSISAMLNIFETKIQEKNIFLVKKYDSNIPKILIGDAARLNQIILNLVSNAVKFTHRGKVTVNVNLAKEDDKKVTINFSVSDTGIGISKDEIPNIFENFQQASSSISRIYGGTGLGLAIVKQLIEIQGGFITVKSEIDKGSEFSFSLDFDKTTEIEKNEIDILELDLKLKSLSVLVVEDMALNQLLMKTLLDEFGFVCEIASNGKIAIDRLISNTYDIILMDLQMPEMNGFEATEYIRKILKIDTPILALTADVTTADVARCKEVGMDDYLAKPVDEKLLYNKIMNLFKKYNLKNKDSIIKKISTEPKKYINLKYLSERTKSNPTLMHEMISIYLEQTPPLITEMKSSFQNSDWESLQKVVHKLIPSFSIMGIDSNFEKMAKKIHEYAKVMQYNDEMRELVKELEAVLLKSCEELNEEIQLLKK